MKPRTQPTAELRAIVHAQGGLITRHQAAQCGMSRHAQHRLIREGRWQRLTSGVLLAHDQEPSWLSLAWAGVLIGGESARIGGEAAAYLHGLSEQAPDHILVWHSGGARSRDGWILRRDVSGLRNPRSVGEPPRTRIEDTVLDLCDSRLGESDRPPIHWLTAAVQKRLTTAERLRRNLANRTRFGGRHDVAALLADIGVGAVSPLELRYLRDVERAHGLPQGERQVRAQSGGRPAFRDLRYERYGVLIELDGKLGHEGSGRFRDYKRDNAALLSGEATMRYGWADVTGVPCEIAAQVAELLIRAGWEGVPIACPRCPKIVRNMAG